MRNVVILGFSSLFTDISSEMVYPILPLYLTVKLGVAPVLVGLIEGIAESLVSFVKIGSGYISDNLKKRKPLVIFGYAGSFFGKLIIFFSTGWTHVFFGRLSDRFGKGVRTAPRDALIADGTAINKRGRSFGLHRMLDSLGAVIGVCLVYYFLKNSSDYKKVFFYSLIPAFIGVLILFFVKESKKATAKTQVAGKTKINFFKDWTRLQPALKIFLIISFIFTLGNSSNQFLLLRSKDLGFSALNVILLYLVYNIAYMLFSYPAGRLSYFWGRKIVLSVGYLCYSLVYFGFAVTKSMPFIWFLFGLYGFYMGLTDGVEKAFVSDLAGTDSRATILGMQGMITGIGLFPASFLAGLLWKFMGPAAPFYFGGFLALISAIAMLIFIPRERMAV